MADSVEDISTEEGIKEALRRLDQREEEVNKLLSGYISRQYDIEAKLNSITRAIPDLKHVHSDADKLADMIKNTAHLAETVSEKVRRLDTTRSRVSECQQRVHDLLDIQLCSVEAQVALRNEDFEKAAEHVERFLSMDETVLKQTADDVVEDCTKVVNSFSLLQDVTKTLCLEVSKRFDEAMQKEDMASVERFFKIYPLLHMHKEGLEKYSVYLTSKLKETAVKNLKAAVEANMSKKPNVIFADAMNLLLEGSARVIEIHQPLVERYYKPGNLLLLISFLQKECDGQSTLILAKFREARNLDKKVHQIKDYYYNKKEKTRDKLEPKNLDILLGELTLMHDRVVLYFKFIKQHVFRDIEASSLSKEAKEKEQKKLYELIENSKLHQNMHIILDNYLLLERYFMEESIYKAISLNSLVEEGSTTSNMVDDVFFIIRKCVRRACASSNVDGVCTVVNNACTFLETRYCDIIKEQLKLGYPSGYLDVSHAYIALQSSLQQGRLQSSDTEAKLMFVTTLNNADTSLEFIETLQISLGEDISRLFSSISEKDETKIKSSLSGFGAVWKVMSEIRDFGMEQLNKSVVEPKIRTWVDLFLNESHKLTEDDVNSYDDSEPFVEQLISNITGLLNSFKTILTPSNYEALVNRLTSEVANNMERVIFETSFNRLGGLILDKEVRALISYLTTTTSWSIRDKFARLIQISTLLNLEKVSEITEWESSGVQRLPASDIEKVLQRRVDFRDDIKNISYYLTR